MAWRQLNAREKVIWDIRALPTQWTGLRLNGNVTTTTEVIPHIAIRTNGRVRLLATRIGDAVKVDANNRIRFRTIRPEWYEYAPTDLEINPPII